MKIDHIVILSLPHRTDRRHRLMIQIQALMEAGVLQATEVKFWDAPSARHSLVPAAWKHFHGYYGCTKGHMEIMEWLWQQPNFSKALIMEDDAEFEPWFAEEFPRFCERIPQVAPDWLALWLGGTDQNPPTPVDERVSLCNGVTQAHAFIVNRHGMHRLYDHLWWDNKEIVDWSYKGLMAGDACVYRPSRWLVTTQDGWSDNRQEAAQRGE